jgi:hypothetical protein
VLQTLWGLKLINFSVQPRKFYCIFYAYTLWCVSQKLRGSRKISGRSISPYPTSKEILRLAPNLYNSYLYYLYKDRDFCVTKIEEHNNFPHCWICLFSFSLVNLPFSFSRVESAFFILSFHSFAETINWLRNRHINSFLNLCINSS